MVDADVPDETLPPEEKDSVSTQSADRILESETTTSYSYIYASGKLLQEKVTTNGTTETHNFFYDNTGKPYAMQINGTTYYYVTNLQGDVMGLVDSAGNTLASYTYDPYGKVLTATGTLAEKNPLRYRGYYYDSESSLYYLQSRYYDPATRRFVNADSYSSTGQGLIGHNMFAYCNNNPIMLLDVNGFEPEWWQWLISGTMVAAGVVLVATGVAGPVGGVLICAGANSMIGSYVSEASGGTTTAGWIGGGVTGALCGLGAGLSGSLLIDATTTSGATCLGYLGASEAVAFSSGFAGSLLGQLTTAQIDRQEVNFEEVCLSSALTGTVNCISGVGAGIGTATSQIPAISTTTGILANSLNAGWSFFMEALSDTLGNIPILHP